MANTVTTWAAAGDRSTVAAALPLRPLLLFFGLAFLVPWLAGGLVIAQNYGVLSGSMPMEPFLILGSWTPNLAAFLVLGLVIRRRNGIRTLLRGWTRWRATPAWYAVAVSPLLMGLLIVAIVRGLLGQSAGDGEPASAGVLAVVLLLALVTGATGEELGWRGFALPRLQARMNALAASVVLGLAWGLWHLPLWFMGFGWEEMSFWLFTLNCVSFSIIATWVCNSTNARLVIVTLMHLFFNFGMFVASDAVLISQAQALPYWSVLLGLFAAGVVLIYGPATLSSRRRVPIDAEGGWAWSQPG
jgi:uncharacterized protein